MARPLRMLCATLAACAAAMLAEAQERDPLATGFRDPPNSARPRVWWHWMDGNINREGIRLDLEWMKRIGIGGVQNFDAALNTPQVVNRRVAYLTPEWRRAFRYAVEVADELGLEFAIAGSPGWSETGGPWVRPEQAMKKLVWSETFVDGGRPFKDRLAPPPSTTGPFQNIPYVAEFAGWKDKSPPQHYADAAVIAYRAADVEVPLAMMQPRVTSSAGALDPEALWDGDLTPAIFLPFAPGEEWIQFSFAEPRRIQALTIVVARGSRFGPSGGLGPRSWLEASDDGRTFRKIADIPRTGAEQQTIAFRPVTASIFRVVFESPDPAPQGADDVPGLAEELGMSLPPVPKAHAVAELVLHTAARVHRFEDKAGFASGTGSVRAIVAADETPAVDSQDAIRVSDVVDLTDRMSPDGTLEWTPPPGRWVVLRLGYSLTGRTNIPASVEGTGLEVDKLNEQHVGAYIDAYLGEYEKILGPALMGKRGLQFMITDSWEAGALNWTDDLLIEFRRRRGYDPVPWLPVLTGRVVQSADASDRFLWDFRKLLGELIADEHYGRISAALHARGLGRYGESHENGRAFVGDGMEVKKSADVPMGAMWATVWPGSSSHPYDADIRESASVAHLYGKNLVAAESLTSYGNPYGFAPETLKPVADRMLAMGLNRFVIHTSVHQPVSGAGPGIGLGPFGQFFTRRETWAEQAKPWITYLARSSFLLQQGRFVADVAYLYGEDTNVTALFKDAAPPVPEGYNFDFANADALLHVLSVRNGRLVTPSGMEYRVLALDPSTRQMSLPVLRRIRDLVSAGAVVTGPRPITTPSLADDETEFRAIVDELWSAGSGGERDIAAGKVYAEHSLAEVLRLLQIPPDFIYTKPEPDTQLLYVHRTLDDGEIYYVSSRNARSQTVEASFRVTSKLPQRWRADTGTIEPLSYRIENGRTIVPLQLDPNDAVFVVFRQPATETSGAAPRRTSQTLAVLDGPWDVRFPPGLGAPASARFDKLTSWTTSEIAGIKYFSGTATYATTLSVRASWLREGARIELDLGEVKNLAEVIVNGVSKGVLWKMPYRTDITDSLVPGENRIEIKVTNLWPNRLIGDKQPGMKPIASATYDPFTKDSPLLPSGLLGPVTLVKVITE